MRTTAMVLRDTFRQALRRARQQTGALGGDITCRGENYHLMQQLGRGDVSLVHLAQRVGPMPFLATVKLSSSPKAAALYAREAEVLRELHSMEAGSASAYGLQHLPVVIAQDVLESDGDGLRQALILRHPNGFWGSLAALSQRYPNGLDPRHAVWIWRRLLDVLHYLHANGWAHGDIRPEHALVHPANHGARVIGWASAKNGASAREKAQDLQHSARVVLVLLCGTSERTALSGFVPEPLAQLVLQACQDEDFCHQHGASGLDGLLRTAARSAFGPPAFVPLHV